ncbi:MAG: hypothetical protein ACFFDQ_13900 [Candidatus Thorarchaeota archaeon]
MPPTVLLRIEHPPVERFRLDPDHYSALLVRTLALALGPWSCTDGADLDEVVDLTLGEVVGVGVAVGHLAACFEVGEYIYQMLELLNAYSGGWASRSGSGEL